MSVSYGKQRAARRSFPLSAVSRRGMIKFGFWAIAAAIVAGYAIQAYTSGLMVHWYYYQAMEDGYAINHKDLMDATVEKPLYLKVVDKNEIMGLEAVRVKKGDVLPQNATGVISQDIVESGRRVALEGDQLKVMIPWEIKESKGVKYKDTFAHKSVQTNPLSGVWNLVMVVLLGVTLGFLAEAFTDMFGVKFRKPAHGGGH